MLWLLRHGDAAEGSPDWDRPLTDKGERQSRKAGRALAKLGVEVDACFSSPRKRALDTARLACESLGCEVSVEDALEGGPFDAREIAGGVDSALLVGHDPDFSVALRDLTGAQVRMKKGGLAAISKGELVVLLRPSEIEAIAD